MRIESYKELRVYQDAFAVAMHIFELSKQWPQEERYALTDQIRRSSRSICANISEAWFRRLYPKHFVSKISDAGSEASETLTWLDFAIACEYITEPEAASLQQKTQHVLGGLIKMMTHPDQWCIPSSRIHEEEVPYIADP